MNKTKVNDYLPDAITALKKCGIADKDGKIISTYRSNISSFGAAVTMGSFKAAVAFFSADAKDNDKASRSRLIQAMEFVVSGKGENDVARSAKEICNDIIRMTEGVNSLREKYINASIALKLAMNAFVLSDPNKKEDGNGKSSSSVQ